MNSEHVFYIDDYKGINESLDALLTGESNPIANMSNAAAILWHSLSQINWAGFIYMIKRIIIWS